MPHAHPRIATALGCILAAMPAAAQDGAQDGARAPIEAAMRYTVKVSTIVDHPFGYEEKGRHSGAGFVVDRARGWIVTNAHVASASPSRIRVNFRNGEPIAARKLHVDALVDLAVLAIPPASIPDAATAADLDCAQEATRGQAAIAFGHPWSLDFTATRGIVSSIRSTLGVEKLQTDAAVNSGNSGGPLIAEATGRVIGVNFARVGARGSTEGLNLAVPARYACTILSLLREGRDPSPPDLPVAFAETSRDRELVVGSVDEPWDHILRVGDRILSVNGDAGARYASRVSDIARGAQSLRVSVRRGDETQEVDLPVPAARLRATPRGFAVSGMLVGTGAAYGMSDRLLVVHNVEDASAADDAELRNMDEIVAMAGKAVSSLRALRTLLEARRDQVVEVIVRRHTSRNEPYMRVLRLEVGELELVGDWR